MLPPVRRSAAAVERAIEIDAPAARVWQVITELERWPLWAAQMRKLSREGDVPLGLGSSVRVNPKGMPGGVWTVTEYDPPRSLTWTTDLAPGLRLVGGHLVEPVAGGSRATFSLVASGALATLLGPALAMLFRRNTRLATDGLKRHCEAA